MPPCRQGIAAEAQQRLLEGQGGQGALLQGEERGFDVASVTGGGGWR